MKKWRFVATGTITLITDVEAETLEEARAQAESREIQSVCHQCSRGNRATTWGLADQVYCETTILDGEEIEL